MALNLSERINVKKFVETQVNEIKKLVGNKKALIAVSGGVDSITCATLTYLAIGKNLICVFIDTGFMRLNEPENVLKIVSSPPLELPIKLIDAKEAFFKALSDLNDAEEKRKAFRETFYDVLSQFAGGEGCEFLVQGTIKADVIETKEGIKTQHNVLEQIGINPKEKYGFNIIEPISSLYKHQVRQVASYLKIPIEICERQPFPGPGLSIRCIGKIYPEKLQLLKLMDKIVEEKLVHVNADQYFAAITEYSFEKTPEELRKQIAKRLKLDENEVKAKTLDNLATGLRNGKRIYGKIVGIEVSEKNREVYGWLMEFLKNSLDELFIKEKDLSRILYKINDKEKEAKYIGIIRAVKTLDFMKANIAPIPWNVLDETAMEILQECSGIKEIYYDITPKPPATIEFE
ncbi:MAG: ATP-binding protein [Candidatus Bathyarchaeia archaeon]